MKYLVYVRVELDTECVVEADSELRAQALAEDKFKAEYGLEFSVSVMEVIPREKEEDNE